jgi:beta-lactamase superfamily II metal-dependent hydrolase
MEVFFYSTGCGDAARITFKDLNQRTNHILIDSGFERTFRNLLYEELKSLHDKGENIALWIVSHIHDDHIGGVIGYISAVQKKLLPEMVERWWYNPPRPLQNLPSNQVHASISQPTSILQGDALAAYLSARPADTMQTISSGSNPHEIAGLNITVISPTQVELNKLRSKYQAPGKPLESTEDGQISEAKGMLKRDYSITVEQHIQTVSVADLNIENCSSIAMITDFHGFKILWLADAHPGVVIQSLRNLGYDRENPFICDWVKVAHHGSAANNTTELYSMIQCNNYLISVNGDNRHGLPNKAAICNILHSRAQPKMQHYKFYFTHDDRILRSIFSIDGDDVFDRLNFSIYYPDNPLWVKADGG